MKRMLGIVMALMLLVVSIVPVAVSATEAEAEVVFTISTIEKAEGEKIAAGETFDITVSTNAIDAIGAVTFKLRYNKSWMKPTNAVASGFLASMADNSINTAPAGAGDALYGEVWLSGMEWAAAAPSTEGGVIATITFEAVKDITSNSKIFCCAEPEAYADWMDTESMTVSYVDGGITIPQAAPTTTTTTTTPSGDDDTPDEPVTEKVSLLPASADKFVCAAGGEGTVAVSAAGDGYKFTADKGWPNASYMGEPTEWVTVDTANEDALLYYDFTVATGEANVVIFFAGQNPADEGAAGTSVSLNKLIDPTKVNADGSIIDLPAGTYKGTIPVKDLECGEEYITDGKFVVSGIKVFAVGGEVVVNELAVDGVKGVEDIETPETTTTTVVSGTTTTVTKQDTAKQDSAKTGDVSNAVVFIVVAVVAAALIAVSVVMSKKKKSN